jgi:hypothetical protein
VRPIVKNLTKFALKSNDKTRKLLEIIGKLNFCINIQGKSFILLEKMLDIFTKV